MTKSTTTSSKAKHAGSPLARAAAHCMAMRWKGTRSEKNRALEVDALVAYFTPLVTCLDDITSAHIGDYVRHLQERGNGAATIKLKLSVLRTIFVEAADCTPPLATIAMPKARVRFTDPPLKWWLNQEDQLKLTTWLRTKGGAMDILMADYVDFVCTTGLRVEEALRITGREFSGLGTDKPNMNVPGTKTSGSQATLPLFPQAAQVVIRRRATCGSGRLFAVRYRELADKWSECREYLGATANPTSTLKALRRSFGRIATEQGMPTEILRHYYRHANMTTTAGYLKLIGGYNTEVVRQWVHTKTGPSTHCAPSSPPSSPMEAYV